MREWGTAAALVLALGCSGDPTARKSLGAQCELNSECAAPLVCRLERCRKECVSSRDCAAGLSCVLDADGLGACQLPEERECALQTDCPSPLVCRGMRCVNACVQVDSPRDCPAGAICKMVDGALGCVDVAEVPCVFDSECRTANPEGEPRWRCIDGRCRRECNYHRDCRFGTRCCSGICAADCPDAGAVDGGTPTGDIVALEAGYNHACVLRRAGDVVCWGANFNGQLGFDSGMAEPTPRVVAALTGVTEIEGGRNHTCVLLDTGAVQCFGNDMVGQLGTGTTGPGTWMPTTVAGVTATALSSWESHTCAVTATGPLCWGSNNAGQVEPPGAGIGDARPTPFATPLPMGTTLVAAGTSYSCGAGPGVPFGCIGADFQGQLGDDPGPGTGFTDVVQIVAGHQHACLRRATGDVWCWGANNRGQIGDGTTGGTRASPVQVAGLTAVDIDAGFEHTCAVRDDARVVCWGSGDSGALADPALADHPTPFEVPGIPDVQLVRTGFQYTCVLTAVGDEVWCWGQDTDGRLGRGVATGTSNPTPEPVMLP